jgi:hypothetical protein
VLRDDHEGIKASVVAGELPGVHWQRSVVHFERNVLPATCFPQRAFSHGPLGATAEVAEDLRRSSASTQPRRPRLWQRGGFVELYGERFRR